MSLTPGNEYDINFEITYKNPDTNPDFQFLVGLPSGLHLESRYSSRVSIVDTAGQEVAAIMTPTSLAHSGGWVNIDARVNGNEITFHYAGTDPTQLLRTQAQAQNSDPEVSGIAVGDSVYKYVGINAGENERDVCWANFYDCQRAYFNDAHGRATELGLSLTPTPFDNEGDAARHCAWMGLTTEFANADFALQLGEAHERDAVTPDGAEFSSGQTGAMDRYNNHTGRNVGLRLDGNPSEIEKVCEDYALAARVTQLPPSDFSGGGVDLVVLKSDLD